MRYNVGYFAPDMRWVALAACALASANLAGAQTPPSGRQSGASLAVRSAVRKGDLGAALRQAAADTAANPKSTAAWQVFGILQTALARLPDAQRSFAEAARLAQASPPTPTGLEDLAQRGMPLYAALERQKVSISLNAGAAPSLNNLGATLVALNRADDALPKLDEAAAHAPDWGGPPANSAIAWLAKNHPIRAEEACYEALRKGARTAKVYTTLAEAVMAEARYGEAEDYLDRAQQLDPEYAHSLFVRAALYQTTLRPRDAQRALFQALALNPTVAAEGRYVPMHNDYTAAGGDQSNDHAQVLSNGQPTPVTYRAGFERTGRDVEDRTAAYQRRYFTQGTLGRAALPSDSTLYGGILNESGERPGMQTTSTTSASSFGFSRTVLSALQGLDAGPGARALFHVGFTHNGVETQSLPTVPAYRPLRDNQLALEARLDRASGPRAGLQAGISLLGNHRSIQAPPSGDPEAGTGCVAPVEPNEQLLKQGTSTLLTLYSFWHRDLSRATTIAGGPVAAVESGGVFTLPYLDLRHTLSSTRSVRLAILPQLLTANADLYPVQALPRPAQSDPISRRINNTGEFNQQVVLPDRRGRTLSYELEVAQQQPAGGRVALTAFHRQFTDVYSIIEDPRLADCLELSPVDRGEANGVEASVHQPVARGVYLQVFARYQQTRSSNQACDCVGLAEPMSQFPTWQGSVRLDAAIAPGWRIGIDNEFVGSRIVRVPDGGTAPGSQNGGYATTVCLDDSPVAASYALNLHVYGRLSSRTTVFLHVYQLAGNGTFYPGYPTRRFIVGGLNGSF